MYVKYCFTGDPTVFNNLPVPEYINKCVVDKIQGQKHNGYNPSIGTAKVCSVKNLLHTVFY
jgi:hypothetical protein